MRPCDRTINIADNVNNQLLVNWILLFGARLNYIFFCSVFLYFFLVWRLIESEIEYRFALCCNDNAQSHHMHVSQTQHSSCRSSVNIRDYFATSAKFLLSCNLWSNSKTTE